MWASKFHTPPKYRAGRVLPILRAWGPESELKCKVPFKRRHTQVITHQAHRATLCTHTGAKTGAWGLGRRSLGQQLTPSPCGVWGLGLCVFGLGFGLGNLKRDLSQATPRKLRSALLTRIPRSFYCRCEASPQRGDLRTKMTTNALVASACPASCTCSTCLSPPGLVSLLKFPKTYRSRRYTVQRTKR